MAGAIEEPWTIEGQEWRSRIPGDMVEMPYSVTRVLDNYNYAFRTTTYILKMMTAPSICMFVDNEGNVKYGSIVVSSIDEAIIKCKYESDDDIHDFIEENKIKFTKNIIVEELIHIMSNMTNIRYSYVFKNIYNIYQKYENTMVILYYYQPLHKFLQLDVIYITPGVLHITSHDVFVVASEYRNRYYVSDDTKTFRHLIDVGSIFYAHKNDILNTKPGPNTSLAVLARRGVERLPEERRREMEKEHPWIDHIPLFTHMHTSR